MECTVDEDLVADGTWIFTQQECERTAFSQLLIWRAYSMRRTHLEGMSATADSWMTLQKSEPRIAQIFTTFLSEVPYS
jgi:hypothetical protein